MEKWQWIVGYEGRYKISSTGRIVSYFMNREHEMKQCLDKDGYLIIGLWLHGRGITKKAHRLVGQAFVPNPNPEIYTQINHLDGNKQNNNDWNLQWCTPAQNSSHSVETGLYKSFGSNNASSKLTESKIEEIRAKNENGVFVPDLAMEYGVSQGTIWRALKGISWARLPVKQFVKQKRTWMTEETMREIKSKKEAGLSHRQIAKDLNLEPVSVGQLINGKIFKNIYATL